MNVNSEPGAVPQVPCGVDEALRVAGAGWPVFPLNPATGKPFGNAEIAAALGIAEPSRGQGGFHLARSDEASVRAMWQARPDAQIGIATGKASGVYVLDLDRKNGKDGFVSLEARNWQPPETYWMNTPSGGRHHFYFVPREGDGHYRSDDRLGSGVDRKGDGGFVRWYGFAFGGEANEMVPPPHWMLTGALGGSGKRKPLGEPSLAAPSGDTLAKVLSAIDPNDLSFQEWIAVLAACKQAWSTFLPMEQLDDVLAKWCERYDADDPSESRSQIASIRKTSVGWPHLLHRVPELRAEAAFGIPTDGETGARPVFGEMLTAAEQQVYFKGCVFVAERGKILTPRATLLNATAFNGSYGGKRFIIDQTGKTTDEPWKAATRSTVWTIPKVDTLRFLPGRPTGEIVTDELGRTAANTYVPARIDMADGDVTPFLNHMARVIPDEGDRRILIEWIAHVVKYPDLKVPWAPLIQSVEGVGKNVLKHVLAHAVGGTYVYQPKAAELAANGSKFNGWMRGRLLILVDEIKIDGKVDLIEVLKPLISEEMIEMESKGVDQEMADNPAHWIFFTNHKDAIPKALNDRRYSVFFSPLQSEVELLASGMDDPYFRALYDDYLGHRTHRRGLRYVAHWLHNYPIERGAVPMRAPVTTSTAEAIEVGRHWLEHLIFEAVHSEANGFRGGWISTAAVSRIVREHGEKIPAPKTMGAAIKNLGYFKRGQSGQPWQQDDPQNKERKGVLWCVDPNADLANYARAQGYL